MVAPVAVAAAVEIREAVVARVTAEEATAVARGEEEKVEEETEEERAAVMEMEGAKEGGMAKVAAVVVRVGEVEVVVKVGKAAAVVERVAVAKVVATEEAKGEEDLEGAPLVAARAVDAMEVGTSETEAMACRVEEASRRFQRIRSSSWLLDRQEVDRRPHPTDRRLQISEHSSGLAQRQPWAIHRRRSVYPSARHPLPSR